MVVRNNIIEIRNISTGNANEKYITVTDGLKAGELVLVSGGKTLNDGDEVTYVQ